MTTLTRKAVKHPAPFSKVLYPWFRALLGEPDTLLDPFAGEGGVFKLQQWLPNTFIVGIEIEEDYCALDRRLTWGDATRLEYPANYFKAVLTSPTYANRMADHHNAKDGSRRIGYKFSLDHALHPRNTGGMQWGDQYRQLHTEAWQEVRRVLCPGGRFILNVGNHIRKGVEVDVAGWHRQTLVAMGFEHLVSVPVKTRRMRYGANRQLRIDHEWVMLFINQK